VSSSEGEPVHKDYLAEAKLVRASVACVRNPRVQQQLMLIAEMYEKLAHMSEEYSSPANDDALLS
jgi:hypothetical protein